MYSCHPGNPIRADDCSSVLRRFSGPEARELFVLCRPEAVTTGAAQQAEATYRGMLDLLGSEGGAFDAVASETLFLRDIRQDLPVVLDARRRVLEEAGIHPVRRVTTAIEQPPLNDGACLELTAHAVMPHRRQPWPAAEIRATPACGCAECSRLHARIVRVADQTCFHAGNIYGAGSDALEQTSGMFGAAEELLRQAGMSFRDVVRTWIYLRDMDRDYAEFNRARREFFRQSGIELHPASTGIGGGPFPERHDLSMSLYAVRSQCPLEVEAMSAPTLNEPCLYGSDFSRGLKVVEANKVALYVSGTASVDEAGRTAHVGDVAAQVDRTLVNIAALLASHGASFRDIVSGITYLKNPDDAPVLRAMFRDRGFEGFGNVLVEAPICRPDLLCEAEVVAVLPRPDAKT